MANNAADDKRSPLNVPTEKGRASSYQSSSAVWIPFGYMLVKEQMDAVLIDSVLVKLMHNVFDSSDVTPNFSRLAQSRSAPPFVERMPNYVIKGIATSMLQVEAHNCILDVLEVVCRVLWVSTNHIGIAMTLQSQQPFNCLVVFEKLVRN